MSRTKDQSLQEVFLKADEALSAIRDSRFVNKLLAIKGHSDHQANELAALFNIQPRTIYKWVEQFRLHGIQGLTNKQKGHRQAILSQAYREQIAKWLDSGKTPDGEEINWTLKSLCWSISQEFGIVIIESALSNTLKTMGYTIRKPRPTHASSSEEDRSAFKKKL